MRPLAPLLLLALVAGCAEAPPPGGRDLLGRHPDRGAEEATYAAAPVPTLRLEDDGEVVHLLELGGSGVVRVRGTAEARGRLLGIVSWIDPRHELAALRPTEVPLQTGSGNEVAGTIHLPDPEGGIVELVLRWSAEDEPGAALALTELTLIESAPLARTPIVFVSVDTLAARHLTLHGYARDTSPHLARFAQSAVVFDQCRTNAPWTAPSYMSQFTGLAPDVFENTRNREDGNTSLDYILPDDRWTMAEMLRAAGYRTAAFVDNPNLALEVGFRQGFEHYDQGGVDAGYEDPASGMEHIGRLALDWLDGLAEDEPYFLFVQPFDVHGPYLPADEWRARFAGDALHAQGGPAPISPGEGSHLGRIPRYIADPLRGEGDDAPRMHTAPVVAAYDAEILGLDRALHEFLAVLERRGVFEHAVVVISADHGESMTGHRAYFTHLTHHESVQHVPLIVRPPGPPRSGRTVDVPVQLVDLYPTFAAFAGLDRELPWQRGRSLVPLLDGEPLPPRPVLGRGGIYDARSIVSDGWKLIETRPWPREGAASILGHSEAQAMIERHAPELLEGVPTPEEVWATLEARLGAELMARELHARVFRTHYELYHLAEDPDEEHDLAASHPDKVAELKALLDAEKERAALAREEFAFDAPQWTPSVEELERLRKLGYAGDR